MGEKNYAYSVARVRSKEAFLLTGSDLEQLLSADSYGAALRLLRDKGYDSADNAEESGSLTIGAEQELWTFLTEIAEEHLLHFLQLPQDYHNIKASVKAVFSNQDPEPFLLPYGSIDGGQIAACVKQRKFAPLPQKLAETAEEALRLLFQMQDGQACETYIDRERLYAMETAAKDTGDAFLQSYTTLFVNFSNWKTALRCTMMQKSEDFLRYALYPGGTLYLDGLVKAAASGTDALAERLEQEGHPDGAESMKQSASAFETWCDNQCMNFLEQAKFESFSAAPILAYFYAKQTELGAVKLILSGKQNRIQDRLIRERVRRLYV